jgi:hypothetical protein
MQIRIPQFNHSLLLKPPLVNQQRIHHTSSILLSPRLLRGFHDFGCDDAGMGGGDFGGFELAGHAFFD